MREVLLERVRPLVERLANDLTELAVHRIETELAYEDSATSNASPILSSSGPSAAVSRSVAPSLAGMMRTAKLPEIVAVEEPVPGTLRVRVREAKPANVPPPVQAECPRVVPASAPPRGQSADKCDLAPARLRSDGKRIGTIICSKCGYVGGNARGCGRSHPTVTGSGADHAPVRAVPARLPTSPAEPDEDTVDERDVTPSNVTKLDRFARIEAAAAARRNGAAG